LTEAFKRSLSMAYFSRNECRSIFNHAARNALASVLLCTACGGSAGPEEESIGATPQAVMGNLSLQVVAPCSVTPTQGLNFGARLTEAVTIGRRVAHMPAMRDCLKQVLTSGTAYRFPLAACNEGQIWGPYCAPDTPGCNTDATAEGGAGDPYRPSDGTGVLAGASDANFAQLLVDRVFVHGRTENPISVTCNATSGGGTLLGVIDPAIVIATEAIVINQQSVVGWAQPTPSAAVHGPIAGLVWHEVMHTHGFDHANYGSSVLCPDRRHLDQVPHIYGECMSQIVQDLANSAVCPQNCTGAPILDAYVHQPNGSLTADAATKCHCGTDPTQPAAMTELDYGVTADNMVVDSRGVVFRLSSGQVFRRNDADTSWTNLNQTGVQSILAGGNRVYYIKNANLFRQSAPDSTTFTNLGSSGSEVVIDDLGTAYRRTLFGTVSQYRLYGSAWETVGSTANRIYAGGDRLFATNSSGTVFRYNRATNTWAQAQAGTSPNSLAVTAIGTLYALSADKTTVFRNDGDQTWTTVGSAAEAIKGGIRLYATNSSLQAWQRWPSSSSSWALAGGGFANALSFWNARQDILVARKSTNNWSRYRPAN
jgi:hypothetical protein